MRKSMIFQSLFSLLVMLSILCPSVGRSTPREVTFFPNTARVQDVTRVSPQADGKGTCRAVLILPAQVIQDSLTAMLEPDSPMKIEDLIWRQVSRQDEARLADLRRRLEDLKAERIGIFSSIQSLDAQIQFWQAQVKAKIKTTEDTISLSALIGKNVRGTLQEKLALEPELEKLDRKIRDLQEEMNRIMGQKETVWEVSLLMSGPQVRETTLTVSYSLMGCGWTPLYRLDARPREGRILFAWDAEIWQSSGIDWSQVETSLATLEPRSRIAPPDLPPWIIRPRPQVPLRGRQKADALLEAPAVGAMMSAEIQGAEPTEIRRSTFAVWNIGKRDIPAGTRQRTKVRDESWSADFLHLLRPSLTSQAFVQASVKLPEAREIPAGQATFLIDGASLGRRPFSFAGQEGDLFFGVDPLVTADAVLLSSKSGEKGFMADRQTHEWAWRLDIRNARDSAARLRLEEPTPQPRDERIRVSLKLEPEPTEKTPSSLIWMVEIPPGQKQALFSTVRVEAPREMELDLGWRR